MLYPQTNRKRLAVKLDGVWQFKKDPRNRGRAENWAHALPADTVPMPVPAAFNEMTQDPELRDYIGVAWYFLTLHDLPTGERKVLRFGAAVHHAEVYLNGVLLAEEHLGKLPFEVDVTAHIHPGTNRLAIRIDTTLNWQTIPPGTVKTMAPTWSTPNLHGDDRPRGEYHFDFLNFGGLLRSVWLLGLPEKHISQLTVRTLADDDHASGWSINCDIADPVRYQVKDADGALICEGHHSDGTQPVELRPRSPRHWSPETPTLYTIEASLADYDFYTLQTGLRTVRVTPDALLLNGKPVYLTGCGLHEDFHLSGHGHSDTRLVKDLTMLKAMGANSFRTAHYPYDEAAYQLADELGLLVIDETAAVGMNAWDAYPIFSDGHCDQDTLALHKRMTQRLVERDHHHPCVIMWSLANEVSCYEPEADSYFKELFEHCRLVDPQALPVTVVQSSTPPSYDSHNSQTAQYCDVICWNRYYAWYQDGGFPEDIPLQLRHEAEAWRAGYPDKPVMLCEFGADAVAGMHSDPPTMFSEEYQVDVIQRYCEALDELPFIIGEHVWNFADFMTKQGLTRVMGNRKGIHTRERQPKMAAHYLKQRWLRKS